MYLYSAHPPLLMALHGLRKLNLVVRNILCDFFLRFGPGKMLPGLHFTIFLQ
jgi:hypothetical protein